MGERRLLACIRRQLADEPFKKHFGKLPKRTGWVAAATAPQKESRERVGVDLA
jgi:hypothetical protein